MNGLVPDAGGAGMRRRYSGQDDGDGNMIHGLQDDGLQTGIRTSARRMSSDGPTIRSSSTDIPTGHMRASTDQPAHVRFSVDNGRPAGRTHKKRKSDELVEEDHAPRALSNARSLSVERQRAVAGPSSGPLSASVQRSPTRTSLPRSGSGMSPTPPAKRRGRNRGMSLRSSLFAKSIQGRSASAGSVIELGEIGSPSRESLERVMGSTNGKKSGSKVTISAISEDSSPSPMADLPWQKGHGVQGVSALPHYNEWIEKRASRSTWLPRMRAAYSKARKFALRINEIPPSVDGRHVMLDPSRKDALIDGRTAKPYVNNTIRSSRYTLYNFLPRQLFFQFSKLANFYFLLVSILQMIPGLSTTGTYTTIIPLLFFVCISMAKEGYDDLRRYRLDKVENNSEASVLHAYRPVAAPGLEGVAPGDKNEGPVHWAPVKWQNLQVGDVVKLERDEAAPADLVLLNSKGPNGVAYVETMALDGETNLKNKQAAPSLAKTCSSAESISANHAEVVVEDPNLDLYNLDGRVICNGEMVPLTNNEIIYRGSILRNTPEAIGMVIYTGEECKIRMNANKNPRIKAPSLQAVVNKIVVLIVSFVIALAIFNSVAYRVWSQNVGDKAWYLNQTAVPIGEIITSFIIMFNTMIPLSLYVSLEIIKVCQMFLLNDVDMYDPVSDTPFEARTSTINEELGQISYIFSDKTGTLTDNSMKFRKLSIAGTAWLHDADLHAVEPHEERLLHKKRKMKGKGKGPMRTSGFSKISHEGVQYSCVNTSAEEALPPQDAVNRSSTSQWHSSARPAKSQPELSTMELIGYIQRRPHTAFARKARLLLISIAVCHTCLPEPQDDGHINFQASSPDELALVRAAEELGYLACNRDASMLTIKSFPHGESSDPSFDVYEILDVIEFSSKRKRMSVVVRFPDGRICVLCKGADSIVMQRLRLASLANQKVVEIEKRASKRKSMEAQQAMERKSQQLERTSFARNSCSRTSMSVGRPSMGRTCLAPIKDDVDGWLTERERDVGVPEPDGEYYSPRPSTQVTERQSLAVSDSRDSFQTDYDDDYELVEESLAVDDSAVIERCFQHINDFATEGLRTLLYGYRFLDDDEYNGWKKVYHDATTSLVNRQDLIEKAGELIEQDLELGGATAIEDKLQLGVPEAIDKLRRANIKMWMLTGDKRETAINIGHSCRLIKDYSSVTVLDHEAGQVEQLIAATIISINEGGIPHSVVVIDGQTLSQVDNDVSLHALFIDLAILADSVICCRASPSQKASLVKAIRKRVSKSVTLAIGDGANDIAMIQEAHVGIGITGKEGLQAARTSDYSIAQFRFLTKLLLVHGRWNYVRICKYTAGTFWKEMMFYLTQALYQRWNGYTGTSLYESWSLSLFNTLFTSLPVIFLGIFEKDLLAATLIAVPELYTKGQRNEGFNLRVYLSWMFMAASEAMIIYFTMLSLYGQTTFTLDNGPFAMGDLTFTACVIFITTKLQVLEQHSKTYMALIAFIASVGGWFLWNIILAGIYHNNGEYNVKDGFFDRFGKNFAWWFILILIVASCCLYEIAVRSLKTAYMPTDVDVFQALEKDLTVRKRFEEAAASELQAGWHHGSKKSSIDLQREVEAQEKREGEVQDLLDKPRVMREGRNSKGGVETEEQTVFVDDGPRQSTDIQEMLSRRFGNVRKEDLTRS